MSKRALLDAAEYLRERAEEVMYGHSCTADPHDFSPDPECATAEEIARHEAACLAWRRGEYKPPPEPWTTWATREAAEAHAVECLRCGAASASVHPYDGTADGSTDTFAVHSHVGGWGIGTAVVRDQRMLDAAQLLEDLAGGLPYDEGDEG